jgi:hypothetical protein
MVRSTSERASYLIHSGEIDNVRCWFILHTKALANGHSLNLANNLL